VEATRQTTARMLLLLTFIVMTYGICYDREVLFPHKRATGSQLFELRPQDDVSCYMIFVTDKDSDHIKVISAQKLNNFFQTPHCPI
jgi:hypothetical protein